MDSRTERVLLIEFHDKLQAYMIFVGLCSPSAIAVKTSTDIWNLDLLELKAFLHRQVFIKWLLTSEMELKITYLQKSMQSSVEYFIINHFMIPPLFYQ